MGKDITKEITATILGIIVLALCLCYYSITIYWHKMLTDFIWLAVKSFHIATIIVGIIILPWAIGTCILLLTSISQRRTRFTIWLSKSYKWWKNKIIRNELNDITQFYMIVLTIIGLFVVIWLDIMPKTVASLSLAEYVFWTATIGIIGTVILYFIAIIIRIIVEEIYDRMFRER